FQVNRSLTHVINNGHDPPRNGHIFGMRDIELTPGIHSKSEWLEWPSENRFADSIGVHKIQSFVYVPKAWASRWRCSTLFPQGSSQLPEPSPSTHSIAAVGQAAAHAGAPPHRLHLLALEVSGSV